MPNTGYKGYATLEQYYVDNGVATGVTKPNNFGDSDYIAPVLDLSYCPIPSPTPSITPTVSVTPTISVTPSVTISVTPTVTASPATPSITPTISTTPTVTPSISVPLTPSITPTISLTPSVTPSAVNYTYYTVDRYTCTFFGGSYVCNYVETTCVANLSDGLTFGKFYLDSINNIIFNIVGYTIPEACLVTNMSGEGTNNCDILCNIIP